MVKVSIRQLHWQTSRMLERVKAGESLEVWEHGVPIALIVPVVAASSAIDRLVGEGRTIAPTRPDALFADVPPLDADESLSQALVGAREAERR